MRTKLTRFLTITVLALVLGIASAAPVAAQSKPPSDTVTIVDVIEMATVNPEARTVTITTTIFYSDDTWCTTINTYPY